MSTFAELGVSAPVCAALNRRGIDSPFAIQKLVMTDALAGRDVLAKSRTGSGKTLAFGIPLAERLDRSKKKPQALVLVPTRELAVQVVDELTDVTRARGLQITAVYGGVGLQDQARRARGAHILVATPGRLHDLIDRRLITMDGIEALVLDEADRMLDMGFQPQVDRIAARVKRARQTMFFSATLDGAVGRLARAYTNDAILHEVASPRQTVDGVEHRFVAVENPGKVDALLQVLDPGDGTTLVFVRTKRGADRLAKKLKIRGVEVVAMHGGLTQPARQRALERLRDGSVDVLVATDVAARGLDVDNITHVINFDLPEDEKAYVHRVGRTARAGRKGLGTTFVVAEQHGDVHRMATRLRLLPDLERSGMRPAPVAPARRSAETGRARNRSRTRRTR